MDINTFSQTALDQLVTDERSQFIKAVVPYLSHRNQHLFSIFAKTMELSNTFSLFSRPEQQIQIQSVPEEKEPLDILKDISQYCYGDSRLKLEQMIQFLSVIQLSQILNDVPEPAADSDFYQKGEI